MIKTQDAINAARALIGTPYSELDCINLIKAVIRRSPGGVPWYTTAGTNALWASANASAKYRDLTWRQDGIAGARAGMLAFKKHGGDVHHVGLVTERGTVIHSSSALVPAVVYHGTPPGAVRITRLMRLMQSSLLYGVPMSARAVLIASSFLIMSPASIA